MVQQAEQDGERFLRKVTCLQLRDSELSPSSWQFLVRCLWLNYGYQFLLRTDHLQGQQIQWIEIKSLKSWYLILWAKCNKQGKCQREVFVLCPEPTDLSIDGENVNNRKCEIDEKLKETKM